MNSTVIVSAFMMLVTVGVLLFRRPEPAILKVAADPHGLPSRRSHSHIRSASKHHEGGATLWISALEGAMALVMVLATLALTDAATATRSNTSPPDQVVVDATPDSADQQPVPSATAGGASPLHPTHRLVAVESSSDASDGAIIIEIDSPLPPNRPVKFLYSPHNSSP